MASNVHIEFPDAVLTGRGSVQVENGQLYADCAGYVEEGDVMYLDLQYGKIQFKHPLTPEAQIGPGDYMICRGGLYKRVLPA